MNAKDPAYEARAILEQVKRKPKDELQLRERTRDGWDETMIDHAKTFVRRLREDNDAMQQRCNFPHKLRRRTADVPPV